MSAAPAGVRSRPTAPVPTDLAQPVVDVRSGAARIGAADWDALVEPPGFYNSRPWTRALEQTHGATPVLAATAAGQLVGVLPTWENTQPSGLFSLDEMTRGLLAPREQALLWLGTRRSTVNTITCVREPGLRRRTLTALLESARRLAAGQGRSGIVWPYLTRDAAREIASCHPLAQEVLHAADAIVDVPADGMEGLEAAARSKSRIQWRREQRLFREAGGSVEWVPLSPEICEKIGPLLARTRDRYGSSGGTAWMRSTLAGQMSSGVARNAVVALTRTGSDLSAAAVFYRHQDWIYGRYWGTSDSAPPYAYYTLTFYAAVDWAAAHGCRFLHLSVPASPAKTARGARLSPLSLVVLPTGPRQEIAEQALTRHNDRMAAELTARNSPVSPAWPSCSNSGEA
ncbi:GNAT family N-acetyltransferase [Streptomyces sp. WI04-05B]|uniref:GNAT family N-acetyltransferase n=1 Tax=Streptomyces TaxID=1883 RepID=UPI0029A48177|nr:MULTISPECIES: GNAT family N-acetyltransferase [unclassified Streptomyces]MDX2545907.1 GNAT family N-acetyltransferase [Streptomyces sp. WI04-05B]MDX2586466.1 GNAT family N-acetyltransferase [Streptomyces sp. WI04-05A]